MSDIHQHYTDDDLRLIAVKPEEVQAEFVEKMNRTTRRRFERILASDKDPKTVWLNQMLTRKEMFRTMELYVSRNLHGYEMRLQLLEQYMTYLEMPFYRRWIVQFVRGLHRLRNWRTKDEQEIRPDDRGVDDGEGAAAGVADDEAQGGAAGEHGVERGEDDAGVAGPRAV